MSTPTGSAGDKQADDGEEGDQSEVDGEEWVVSPEDLKNGEFHTLADADERLSE